MNSVNGTMTYYGLWPNNLVGDTEFQNGVQSDYSKGVVIKSLLDLIIKDQTGSKSGNVSAEGRASGGIVRIGTTYDEIYQVQPI